MSAGTNVILLFRTFRLCVRAQSQCAFFLPDSLHEYCVVETIAFPAGKTKLPRCLVRFAVLRPTLVGHFVNG